MNKLDKQYTDLLQDILDNGIVKKDRTGTGTISVFGRQIRHKMSDGFPLLTTKKIAWEPIVTELLWFLRGDTNIKYLVDNGCNIWNGDTYKNYFKKSKDLENVRKINLGNDYNMSTIMDKYDFIEKIKGDIEFSKKWGELGPIYGGQWRNWGGYISTSHQKMNGEEGIHIKGIDQIKILINNIKNDPDSRRLIVSAWNVADLNKMVLPPCHNFFQCYTRELSQEERKLLIGNKTLLPLGDPMDSYDEANIPKRAISLMWNQRSVDTFLGLPFNIASYGLLLEIIADEVNMVPEELIGNLGDVHLYTNHIEQANEQIGREYTYEERYDLWFTNNYETGMEKNYDILPDFDNTYYKETPKRTREPFSLPSLIISTEFWNPENILGDNNFEQIINGMEIDDFQIIDYNSHSAIKAPLSN